MANTTTEQPMEIDGTPAVTHPDRVVNAEEVLGKMLVDSANRKLGRIHRVDHDRESGVVDFMTVVRGGFLHYGAEWFEVPVTRIVSVESSTVTVK